MSEMGSEEKIPFSAGPLNNWSDTVVLTTGNVLLPRNEEEVVSLVRLAASRGSRLHVVGSRHSWSDVAAASKDGDLLSLEHMDALVAVDKELLTVTIEGGMTIMALNMALREYDLALPFNASTVMPTFIGAAATGTHASSLQHGNFGTLLRQVRLVDGTGAVRTISRGDEAMKAVAC